MTNTSIADPRQDNGPATPEPAPESLDKVRDILFGGQMRAVESRLQGLEARLLQAQENLRAEFTKQVDTLDGVLQREVQALTERLAAERSNRIEELKALAGELRDVLREHEQRHLKLEATMGTADAELREGILQHSQVVSADLARLTERLTGDLTRAVAELQHDKASRASLTALFSELASRLSGQGGEAGAKAD
ncbi:MAG TPA: hypothetical protein VGQ69_05975 [Gemmatimonadales bacterium]|jgi:hypothetical protein|nr:hypothetical protein [Gemmatimonadales bacterium]